MKEKIPDGQRKDFWNLAKNRFSFLIQGKESTASKKLNLHIQEMSLKGF